MAMSSDSSLSSEIIERQRAELEFVAAAYSADEAWSSSSNHSVHRLLKLHLHLDKGGESGDVDKEKHTIPIELILTMPQDYPINPNTSLDIEAFLQNSECRSLQKSLLVSNDISARKLALDAIPNLIQVCNEVASDDFLEEAVLVVLQRADDWVENEWREIVTRHHQQQDMKPMKKNQNQSCLHGHMKEQLLVGRKLIYSHHIIAKSKRKALKDISRQYELGGYVKIGWPGIIIIEGDERNCNTFIDEIRKWRWQYLVVRGEDSTPVSDDSNAEQSLNAMRKFHLVLEELEEMSDLAVICREAGLEDLFLTSMKMYKRNDEI